MGEVPTQDQYVAVRVGFEPATIQTQGNELTTDPPRPNLWILSETLVFNLLQNRAWTVKEARVADSMKASATADSDSNHQTSKTN